MGVRVCGWIRLTTVHAAAISRALGGRCFPLDPSSRALRSSDENSFCWSIRAPRSCLNGLLEIRPPCSLLRPRRVPECRRDGDRSLADGRFKQEIVPLSGSMVIRTLWWGCGVSVGVQVHPIWSRVTWNRVEEQVSEASCDILAPKSEQKMSRSSLCMTNSRDRVRV